MASTHDDLTTRPTRTPASGESTGRTAPAAGRVWTVRLVVIGMVLAALNLRPAISGLGPLLEEVRRGLGMSGTVAGMLTSMPSLCFAVFGGLAPRLARRWGPAVVVLAGMVAVTAGLAVRSFAHETGLFLAASALALAGIAVSNVLMPVVVKHWFPDRVGSMTGLYSMALAVGTAGAAAVTVPMAEALGGSWRVGIGAWAVLGIFGVLPWAAVAARPRDEAAPADAGRPGSGDGTSPRVRITASTTAWALACFFGLQASAAYVTMGWLPQIFRDAGLSASTAGLLLACTMGMGIPLSFVVPRVAARMRHQGPLVALLGVCGLLGYAGLWWAPAGGAWVWALLLGFSNCAFPVALTMIGMRSRTGGGVVKLSAFAQSTGYLISVPGPLLVGALRGSSGGWHLPLILMAALMTVQIAVGVLAGRDRCVEDGSRVRH